MVLTPSFSNKNTSHRNWRESVYQPEKKEKDHGRLRRKKNLIKDKIKNLMIQQTP